MKFIAFLLILMGSLILLRIILSFLMGKRAHVYLMYLMINVSLLIVLTLLIYIEKDWIFVIRDSSDYLLLFIFLFIYGKGIIQIIKDYKDWKLKDSNQKLF